MHATFHSHQSEIDQHVAETQTLGPRLDFPVTRAMSSCVLCRRPKGRGLLLCWDCIDHIDGDRMDAEHALELIADFEAKNTGDPVTGRY